MPAAAHARRSVIPNNRIRILRDRARHGPLQVSMRAHAPGFDTLANVRRCGAARVVRSEPGDEDDHPCASGRRGSASGPPRVAIGAGAGMAVPFHGDFDFTPWAWDADIRSAMSRRVLLEVTVGDVLERQRRDARRTAPRVLYSRSASNGSTRAARRAGTKAAASPATIRIAQARP